MSSIDPFLDALFKRGADRIVLAVGAKAVLHTGDRARAITNGVIVEKLLESMLREIAPEDLCDELEQDGEHGFESVSSHGRVSVRVRRAGERFSLELIPAADPDEDSLFDDEEPEAVAAASAVESAAVSAAERATVSGGRARA